MIRNAAGRTSFVPESGKGEARASRPRLPTPSGPTGLAASLLDLQRTAGNQAVATLLREPRPRLQAQLRSGQPGDASEREAYSVADSVAGPAAPRVPTGFTAQLAGLRGSGAPLSPALRGFFEPRFGNDFGAVRLHTGALAERSADAVHARAFTLGNDVVFGHGEYAPDSPAGRHLLAHELTHVVQQTPMVRRQPMTPDAGEQTSLLAGMRTEDRLDRRGNLPYRQAVELQECIHIMGDVKAASCGEIILGAETPAGVDAFAEVLDWPTLLPRAGRNATHAITIKKGTAAKKQGKLVTPAVQNTAVVPAIPMPHLDKKQQAIIEYVKMKRAALPDRLTGTAFAGKAGGGGIGYMYGGRNPGAPTSVKAAGTDDKAKHEKWIWEEVGSEGGASSINTYDTDASGSDNVTFGMGFAKSTLPSLLKALFAKDPEIKKALLDAGLALDGSKWLIVNTDLGAVEEGTDALRLLEVNTKLLSLLMNIGEDPKHAQTNLDVQWAAVMAGGGKYPQYAATWSSENAFKIAFHMAHWLPAYSWASVDYSPTDGDILKIVKTFAKAAAGKAAANGVYLVPARWGLLSHLAKFGAGKGLTELKTAAGDPVAIENGKEKTDPAYSDKLLIPEDRGKYLVLDAAL